MRNVFRYVAIGTTLGINIEAQSGQNRDYVEALYKYVRAKMHHLLAIFHIRFCFCVPLFQLFGRGCQEGRKHPVPLQFHLHKDQIVRAGSQVSGGGREFTETGIRQFILLSRAVSTGAVIMTN